MKKVCSNCGSEFTVPDTYVNSTSWCQECIKEGVHDRNRVKKGILANVLARNPCQVCGESDPDVLVLHHLVEKHRNAYNQSLGRNGRTGVSELMQGTFSVSKFVEELNKCAVLCWNDHVRLHKGKVDESILTRLDLPVPPKAVRGNRDEVELAIQRLLS